MQPLNSRHSLLTEGWAAAEWILAKLNAYLEELQSILLPHTPPEPIPLVINTNDKRLR